MSLNRAGQAPFEYLLLVAVFVAMIAGVFVWAQSVAVAGDESGREKSNDLLCRIRTCFGDSDCKVEACGDGSCRDGRCISGTGGTLGEGNPTGAAVSGGSIAKKTCDYMGQTFKSGETAPCELGITADYCNGECSCTGRQTCENGRWGECKAREAEVCNNFIDDNCNGKQDEEPCGPPPCDDSDGGKDYYTKGSVTATIYLSPPPELEVTLPDECFNAVKYIRVTYTDPQKTLYELTETCSDEDLDTDGILQIGECIPSNIAETASCTGQDCFVREVFCTEWRHDFFLHRCPNGCMDGACIQGAIVCSNLEISDIHSTETPREAAFAESPISRILSFGSGKKTTATVKTPEWIEPNVRLDEGPFTVGDKFMMGQSFITINVISNITNHVLTPQTPPRMVHIAYSIDLGQPVNDCFFTEIENSGIWEGMCSGARWVIDTTVSDDEGEWEIYVDRDGNKRCDQFSDCNSFGSPPRTSCEINRDCIKGQVCYQGICLPCNADDQCGLLETCQAGVCTPAEPDMVCGGTELYGMVNYKIPLNNFMGYMMEQTATNATVRTRWHTTKDVRLDEGPFRVGETFILGDTPVRVDKLSTNRLDNEVIVEYSLLRPSGWVAMSGSRACVLTRYNPAYNYMSARCQGALFFADLFGISDDSDLKLWVNKNDMYVFRPFRNCNSLGTAPICRIDSDCGAGWVCMNGACVLPRSCEAASVGSIGELPMDEDKLRYFFEVLLPGSTSGNPSQINTIRGVTRWNNEDCVIPIYFENGWGTQGGQAIKKFIEDELPVLTGRTYSPVFLNDNPDASARYGNERIIVRFSGSKANGVASLKYEYSGTWKNLTVFKGHRITSGVLTFPSSWMGESGLNMYKKADALRELGHVLGYGDSWQMDSFMSREVVRYYGGIKDWESNMFRTFYRIPVGTSPQTIYNTLGLDRSGLDIISAAPVITETRRFAASVPTTEFVPGETRYIAGRRLTSGRGCACGDEPSAITQANTPAVYIGDRGIPVSLGGASGRSDDCLVLLITVPQDMSPGHYDLKVFTRGKWSNVYPITVVSTQQYIVDLSPSANAPNLPFKATISNFGAPMPNAFGFVKDSNNRIVKTFRLYNDGRHGDGGSTDHMAANTFTMERAGRYNLSFCIGDTEETCVEYRKTIGFDVRDFSCQPLFLGHNDADADRINIILVGVNYDSMDQFKETAKNLLAWDGKPVVHDLGPRNGGKMLEWGLFSIEPFKSNKDKFNIWYLSEMGDFDEEAVSRFENRDFSDLESYYGDLPYCDLDYKYKVFIVNEYFVAGGGMPSFSDDQRIEKKNMAFGTSYISYPWSDSDRYSAFVHEACHSLIGLRDESAGSSPYTGYPNCASSQSQASAWQSGLGVSAGDIDPFYYEYKAAMEREGLIPFSEAKIRTRLFAGGCGAPYGDTRVYKPTEESIMTLDYKYPVLGSVNRARAEQVLDMFAG